MGLNESFASHPCNFGHTALGPPWSYKISWIPDCALIVLAKDRKTCPIVKQSRGFKV